MKKQKIILGTIIFAIIILMVTVVKATDIKVEKIVTGTDGSIDFIISGLELEDSASYEWAIEKTNGTTIENWYNVLAPDYEANSLKITVNATEKKHLDVLKSSDVGYITIRKVGTTTNILDNQKVDLTIPLLKAFILRKDSSYGSADGNPAYSVKTIYGIQGDKIDFSWEKIIDPNIVNNYIDKDHDISGLSLKGKESFPSLSSSTWKTTVKYYGYANEIIGEIRNNQLPKENGLYYLWLKGSGTDVKTVYGQCVIEVGEVTKITDNTQTGNEQQTPTEDNKGEQQPTQTPTQTQKPSTTPTKQTGNTADGTSAKGTLPNTGKGTALLGIIGILTIIVSVIYSKNKEYRDIK